MKIYVVNYKNGNEVVLENDKNALRWAEYFFRDSKIETSVDEIDTLSLEKKRIATINQNTLPRIRSIQCANCGQKIIHGNGVTAVDTKDDYNMVEGHPTLAITCSLRCADEFYTKYRSTIAPNNDLYEKIKFVYEDDLEK